MTKADFLDISKEAVLLSKMLLNAMNTAGAIVIANWAGSEKKEFNDTKYGCRFGILGSHFVSYQN